MSFSSFTFFLFLSAVFCLYWALRNSRQQNALLVLSGYIFYSWWDPRFTILMLISSVVDYYASLAIERSDKAGTRKRWLLFSLCTNLGMLGFFKYFNFFYDSLVTLLQSIGMEADYSLLQIVLPVGISFYTFQTMSYTIDVYRGKCKATTSFLDYSAYVTFFPQLVAGPIERADRLLSQLQRSRTFDMATAKDGLRQILWGLFKKLVLADNLGQYVSLVYIEPGQYSGGEIALATVCFALQIYCDFSAYSDIAIGVAKLFGIRLMRNFALPYFSQSIDEFWRRWHISLHLWFRDYVYFPLGGSRGGKWKQARNVILTFTLSGLWHGASWNFIIWGFLNGLAAIPAIYTRDSSKRIHASDKPGGDGWFPGPMILLKMVSVSAFVCLTWVFFRAETFDDAITAITRMVTFAGRSEEMSAIPSMPLSAMTITFLLTGVFILVEWLRRSVEHPFVGIERIPAALRWLIYTIVLWIIFYRMALVVSPFIYFQF